MFMLSCYIFLHGTFVLTASLDEDNKNLDSEYQLF